MGVIVLILIGGGIYYAKGRTTAPKLTTGTVRKGDINASVAATGTINPLTTAAVGSFVSGTVQYIFADFNTKVVAGQVLTQLDPAIFEAQVQSAQGNLQNAKSNLLTLAANVQVAQANLAKAQANASYEERLRRDRKTSFPPESSRRIRTILLNPAWAGECRRSVPAPWRKPKLPCSGQFVGYSMTGALKQAQTNLKYTTIVSPIAGTVVARNVDVGQSVAASLSAPNVFSVAQDLTRMQVFAATDESDTGNISVGTNVSFQVDAFPTDQFHGRVSTVRLNATTVQNVVTYNTVIDFDNPAEKLLPGRDCLRHHSDRPCKRLLLIPNAALTFTPAITRPQQQALYKQYNISREASASHQSGWQVVWKQGPKTTLHSSRRAMRDNRLYQYATDIRQPNEGDVLITGEQTALGAGKAGRGGGEARRAASGLGGR